MCYQIIQNCSVYVSFPPQADGEPKELKGMPALMHMINDIKEKHANKEKIGLHDLDTIVPYKCIMHDTDRNELGAIARNAISELGSMAREGSSEKVQSTLLSTAEAPYFDENHPFVATCICICLLGHVFTCFPVGVACGVVAVARAMWLVQCAASAQTICHMCAANKTYRCDSRTLWQHHVAMALPLSFLCVVYVLAFKKTYEWF